MHVHTINSDGQYTPPEVIDIARSKGVKTLVFTDHSGITHSKEIVSYAKRAGIEIPLMGIEISTIHKGNKYHVLGYAKNFRNSELESYLMYPTAIKNERYIKIIEMLRSSGYNIPVHREMLKGINVNGTYMHKDKWMFTGTLIASYVSQVSGLSPDEARSLFSGGIYPEKRFIYIEKGKSREERYLPTCEVIRKLREYGAVTILAHPWWECTGRGNTTENVIAHFQDFIDAGLAGFEALSQQNDECFVEAGNKLDKMYPHLLHVGGSDYHGDKRPDLGVRGVTEENYRKLMEMVRI
nr:PHP domain-containing protein [Paenibacillus periandrae]